MAPADDNAVAHYRHLREQGVKPSDAVEHARLRFGIDADTLRRRVNGLVADSDATVAALAEARESILAGEPMDTVGGIADFQILRRLYTAITGESI
jgi:hypothetical protein